MMKSLLAASLCLSFTVSASAQSSALWVGKKQVTAPDYQHITALGIDMHDFANKPNKSFCFEGDSQAVLKIIAKILEVGTGDTQVTGNNSRVSESSIEVDFTWFGEDGGHRTRRTISKCH